MNEVRLYFGKSWMQTPEGKALGPVEVFQAFCGIIDLQCDGDIGLDATKMEPVSQVTRKIVRQKLMEQGIDFMDSDVIAGWDQLSYEQAHLRQGSRSDRAGGKPGLHCRSN